MLLSIEQSCADTHLGANSAMPAVTTAQPQAIEPARVVVGRNLCDVAGLREIWSRWQWHPNSDIDHYLTVLHSMDPDTKPLVLTVYRSGTPQAMLVGRLESGKLSLRIGYKDLCTLKIRKMVFIYGGWLGDCSLENSKMFMQAICEVLRRGEADVAFINSISVGSPLYLAATEFQPFLVRDHAPVVETHRSMKISADPKGIDHILSPKVRKNLGWQARKLIKDFAGNVQLRCFRQPTEVQRMLRDLEEVARKTYQRRLGVGFIDTSLMRQRLAFASEKGWLRTYVLYIGEQPCAFWSGTLYQQTFHSDFMGYDPEYSKYSPGMFVIMEVIKEFCQAKGEDKVAEVDFGLGDAQYKTVLGNTEWCEASIYLFAPTLSGFGLNLFRTPTALVNHFAKNLLERTMLLQKAKTIWRHRIRNH